MEIVPAKLLRRGSLTQQPQPIMVIFDLSTAISRKRCNIGGKLLGLLSTNRKSDMGFRLVRKSVTLNDRERRNGRYFALLQRIR